MYVSVTRTFLLSIRLCVQYAKDKLAARSSRYRILFQPVLQQSPLALRLPVDVLHVHFEVVVPGELLVAQLALGHGPVRVVRQLMPAEHLLQAE